MLDMALVPSNLLPLASSCIIEYKLHAGLLKKLCRMKLCTSKHLEPDTWVHIFFWGLGKATRLYHFFSSCCQFIVNVIQSVESRPPVRKLYG